MTQLRRRLPVLALAAALAVPAVALGHELFDHPVPSRSEATPPSPAFQAGGTDARWQAVGTIATGNPHTDLDFFTSGGETYAAVGTLASGANAGGVTIVKLVDKDGKVTPKYVTGHPSASCVSNPSAALGLQHDIEVTPKPATAPLNTPNAFARLGDAQLIIDATDASGRCHDQGIGGIAQAPRGGLEIVDVSDGADSPKEIGLTSHIGEAHTVNIDPKRPHIAYAVTSDLVPVDENGVRQNEEENLVRNAAGQQSTSSALDGFEVVDLSSCMNFPAGTTAEQKRAACKPQVYRYRYPSAAFAQGHSADDESGASRGIYGCHELEIYPDDRLTCGAGAVSLLFDMKGAFDDNGTPADFTDDKPRGTPLPCRVRESTTAVPELKTGAPVTDCVTGELNGEQVDLRVPNWKKIGAPSLEGVQHLGTARHIGRATTGQRAKFDSTQDIDFSHESELTHSGRYLISSDERGGGVVPPGASCDTPDANKLGNGGLHFYDVSRLQKDYTGDPETAWQAYARTPDGDKAIYRARIRTGAQATICTAHVFHQVPGQNRIFMGWYSQGTQVVDYVERRDGTLELKEAGYFIPANANEWVSAIYKTERNDDGTYTYYGAAGDFNVGQGRNAIDLYKVTLPGPPEPRIDASEAKPAAEGPVRTAASSEACVASKRLRDVSVKPRKRGRLRLRFKSSTEPGVDVTIFRVSRGDRVLTARRVKRFLGREKSFTWRPKARMRPGAYLVRFRVPNTASAKRVAVLRKRNGRFAVLAPVERRQTCDEVRRLALTKPVFGGKSGAPLRVVAQLTEAGTVQVELLRGGKVVRKTKPRVATPDKRLRVNLRPKGLKDGVYVARVTLRFGQTLETVTLGALKL